MYWTMEEVLCACLPIRELEVEELHGGRPCYYCCCNENLMVGVEVLHLEHYYCRPFRY